MQASVENVHDCGAVASVVRASSNPPFWIAIGFGAERVVLPGDPHYPEDFDT